MKKTGLALAVIAGTTLLSACEPAADGDSISVSAADDKCDVSADSADSGTRTFSIENTGTKVTEFYILGDDGLRVVAEKENIAPGSTADLTVSLQPGDYFTACKPGLRGANIGQTDFKVTGEAVEVSGSDKELFDKVVADYVKFVQKETGELEPKVEKFADAYAAGEDEKARDLFASTRVHYERIEPIAEALGTLDPRIDYREVDYLAEEDQLKKDDPEIKEWTGFHRMEKDLWEPKKGDRNSDGSDAFEAWKPSTPEDRQRIADALKSDVKKLNETVNDKNFIKDNQIDVDTVSNGASGLLEEVAVSKVTGEEDWWSHTDLYDFAANIEGSRIAFDLVRPIAESKGEEGKKLADEIDKEYGELEDLLGEYGSLEKGFPSYATVNAEQQAELTAQIDELREPLSKLTGTVLGIEESE